MNKWAYMFGCFVMNTMIIDIFADIKEINSIKEVEQELLRVDKETLVIFDIVHTLLFVEKNGKHYTARPVEKKTVELIGNLQKSGIKTMALTQCESCQFDRRVTLLQMIGVDFSKGFDSQEVTFSNFKPYRGYYPRFYKGILMALDQSKGDVLGAFLDYMKLQPSKILFFDDTELCNKQVAKELEKRKIPYRAYWYHGAR